MCGRYTHLFSWEELHQLLDLVVPPMEAKKSYNVAPTQCPPILRRQADNSLKVDFVRWGLIPSWTKDLKSSVPLINAKAETVDSKPSFRSAFQSRRCLVPISGYYEWVEDKATKKKQAYYISPINKAPLFLAGLWESWKTENSQPLESFTIITTAANDFLSELHDRMPVVLQFEDFDRWLADSSTSTELKKLLVPASRTQLQFYAVSSLVNSPKNNSLDCILKVEEAV